MIERLPAVLHGWSRRFWQGSHDHRGTPAAPGRVVTLVREPGGRCDGVAYRVSPDVFPHLDQREINGYQRHRVALDTGGGSLEAVTYIAARDNPAFLGPAPVAEMVDQIAAARGPSGANSDYVVQLARALEALNAHDDHVTEVAGALGSMSG